MSVLLRFNSSVVGAVVVVLLLLTSFITCTCTHNNMPYASIRAFLFGSQRQMRANSTFWFGSGVLLCGVTEPNSGA
jgi:hypothetical protein